MAKQKSIMYKSIIIIPTLNEIENIEHIIDAIFRENNHYHILIVDDSSTDGTIEKVNTLQSIYPNLHLIVRNKDKGLGKSYITGFQWCISKKYDYILEMDADFSHNPKDIQALINICHVEGYDVAIGSRYINNKINVINWDFKRLLLSYFASKYVKLITRMPIYDTTAGFVCYKRAVLEKINFNKIRFSGYAFQIEMKFNAWKNKASIKELSIIFTDRTKGNSKLNGSIITEAIFGVLKMKIISLFKS